MNIYEVKISKSVVVHVTAKDEFEAEHISMDNVAHDQMLNHEMLCVDVLGCIEENIKED